MTTLHIELQEDLNVEQYIELKKALIFTLELEQYFNYEFSYTQP